MNEVITLRREYSKERTQNLIKAFAEGIDPQKFLTRSIFVAGSFARLEASEHSDIDLFFLHTGDTDTDTDEELFTKSEEIVNKCNFLPLTRKYLKSHETYDIRNKIGSADEDYENYFTTRMLLLLEGRPIYNKHIYDTFLEDIINVYFADYHSHSDNFRPIFLVNDIIRYWKTLCLNYENRRHQYEDSIQAKVKNFKLKFSRLNLCFSTITYLFCLVSPSPEQVLELVKMPPIDRLIRVGKFVPDAQPNIDSIIEKYVWFLSQTALTTNELNELFQTKKSKALMFRKGNEFGDEYYKLIQKIDGSNENRALRYIAV